MLSRFSNQSTSNAFKIYCHYGEIVICEILNGFICVGRLKNHVNGGTVEQLVKNIFISRGLTAGQLLIYAGRFLAISRQSKWRQS